MKMMYRRTRFWRAESERAAGLVPALPVASSTLRTLGGHTPIVSKAGLGATRVNASLLPPARGSDGGGAPRSAVCRWQPVRLGRGTSNTRPYNYRRCEKSRGMYPLALELLRHLAEGRVWVRLYENTLKKEGTYA